MVIDSELHPVDPVIESPTQLEVLVEDHSGYLETDNFISINALADETRDINNTHCLTLVQLLYAKVSRRDDNARYFSRGKEVKSSFDK